MNLIKDFDPETIALFDLSLLGPEVYIHKNRETFLFIPFYKLGHYDDIKGMTHTFHLGYLLLKNVSGYSVRLIQYSADTIDYTSEREYEMKFDRPEAIHQLSLEDLGFRTTGLVALSMNISYESLHLAYDFISPDCAPTYYSTIIQDQSVTAFLLNPHLSQLNELIDTLEQMA